MEQTGSPLLTTLAFRLGNLLATLVVLFLSLYLINRICMGHAHYHRLRQLIGAYECCKYAFISLPLPFIYRNYLSFSFHSIEQWWVLKGDFTDN